MFETPPSRPEPSSTEEELIPTAATDSQHEQSNTLLLEQAREAGKRLVQAAVLFTTLMSSGNVKAANKPTTVPTPASTQSEKMKKPETTPFGKELLAAITNHSVVIIGYQHQLDSTIPDEISTCADQLKERHLTSLMVEVVPEDEKDLSRMATGKVSQEAIDFFRIAYGKGFPHMICKLNELGIMIYAGDLPSRIAYPENYETHRDQYIPSFLQEPIRDTFEIRNQHFAQLIYTLHRKNNNDKVLLLIGDRHGEPIKKALTEDKIDTILIHSMKYDQGIIKETLDTDH